MPAPIKTQDYLFGNILLLPWPPTFGELLIRRSILLSLISSPSGSIHQDFGSVAAWTLPFDPDPAWVQ